jgi:cobalamin-dependent methionine synthase I
MVVDINLDDGLLDGLQAMQKFCKIAVTEPDVSRVRIKLQLLVIASTLACLHSQQCCTLMQKAQYVMLLSCSVDSMQWCVSFSTCSGLSGYHYRYCSMYTEISKSSLDAPILLYTLST